jgi:hypothetical protein
MLGISKTKELSMTERNVEKVKEEIRMKYGTIKPRINIDWLDY